jgi:hypothetical protein
VKRRADRKLDCLPRAALRRHATRRLALAGDDDLSGAIVVGDVDVPAVGGDRSP